MFCLKALFEPKDVNYFAVGTGAFDSVHDIAEFVVFGIGEEDGDFGVEPFVESAAHEADPFVVSGLHYFALVVKLDEHILIS